MVLDFLKYFSIDEILGLNNKNRNVNSLVQN